MGILGGKFTNDDDDGGGGDAVTLPLDDVVCAECGRDLAPWMTECPDDGGAPTPRAESMVGGPAIPTHLLDGIDEDDDTSGDDSTERGGTGDLPGPDAAGDDRPAG